MEKALNNNIRVILGLDLGVGSIGWALIEVDEADKPVRIVDTGVRGMFIPSFLIYVHQHTPYFRQSKTTSGSSRISSQFP